MWISLNICCNKVDNFVEKFIDTVLSNAQELIQNRQQDGSIGSQKRSGPLGTVSLSIVATIPPAILTRFLVHLTACSYFLYYRCSSPHYSSAGNGTEGHIVSRINRWHEAQP